MIRKLNTSEEVLIVRCGRRVESVTTNVVMLALAQEPLVAKNWSEFETTLSSGGVYKAVANFSREYAEERNCQDTLESGLREYADKMDMPLEDLNVFLFGDYYRVNSLPLDGRLVRVRVDQTTTAPLNRFLKNIGIAARRLRPSVPEELQSIEDRFLLGASRILNIADNGNLCYSLDKNTGKAGLEYEMTADEYSQRNNDCC